MRKLPEQMTIFDQIDKQNEVAADRKEKNQKYTTV